MTSQNRAAIVAMTAMPLTYQYQQWYSFGIYSLCSLLRILTGQAAKTHPAIWIIAVLSVLVS